jgi:hypothetical protein
MGWLWGGCVASTESQNKVSEAPTLLPYSSTLKAFFINDDYDLVALSGVVWGFEWLK